MRPNLAFGPIDSLTQYLLYLSVVVFGILLPLAIQRWAKRRQERLLLAATRASLADEVAANRARVQKSHDSFVALAAHLGDEIAQYRALWEAAARPPAGDHLPEPPATDDLPVVYAATVRTAWDTASIRQALPLLPANALAAYARAYQLQHALEQNRESFLAAAMRTSALEAPTDLRVAGNVERRIATLLELQAFARHHAGLAGSLLAAYDATRDDGA